METDNKTSTDFRLRQVLECSEQPSPELLKKVKNSIQQQEDYPMKNPIKRGVSTVAVVVIAMLLVATTTFAAWQFLKPAEIARQVGDNALSAAFESATAININESITSGAYTFTLLALVSGEDITSLPYFSEDVRSGRSYAVLAIQKADGSAMPANGDSAYGETPFFATPLVKGLKPWFINAATLNGAYSETVVEGVLYRLVECDDVSIFADRGLYFAVSTDVFYNRSAFLYDENTGVVVADPAYEGSSVVFGLPVDPALGDAALAAQVIESLYPAESITPESSVLQSQ
jgi:hypothetical protein